MEEQVGQGVQNTLGVIKVVEGLFNAMRQASFPLNTHDAIVAGMNFLSQFHNQLVGQLPPGLVEELRKANGVDVQEKPQEVTNGQPA
jgi:hypothetical protein